MCGQFSLNHSLSWAAEISKIEKMGLVISGLIVVFFSPEGVTTLLLQQEGWVENSKDKLFRISAKRKPL